MAEKRMKRGFKKERKESLMKRLIVSPVKRLFTSINTSLKKTNKASLILFIVLLFCTITGIFGFYLAEPAKEMYVAESTYIKETRNVYDYGVNSEERAAQEAKVTQARATYDAVMNKYTASENAVIKGYANIHANFFKGLIAFAIVLPFVVIVLMAIAGRLHFVKAVINLFVRLPLVGLVLLIKSFVKDNSKNEEIEVKEEVRKLNPAPARA